MAVSWGVAVVTLVAAVAAAGAGTGGGALYMPAYVLAYHDAHQAVPLSKATIFGLAIASFFANVRRSHPQGYQKSLINLAVAALLEPPTLLGRRGVGVDCCVVGAFLGVSLNLLLPSLAILTLLVICLSVTTYSTVRKALQLYRIETTQETGLPPSSSAALPHPPTLPHAVEEQTPLLLKRSSSPRESVAGPKVIGDIELLALHVSPSYTPLLHSKDPVMDEVQDSRDARFLSVVSGLYLVGNWACNYAGLYSCGGPAAVMCGDGFQKTVAWGLIVFHVVCSGTFLWFLVQFERRRRDRGVVEEATAIGGYEWLLDTRQLRCLAGLCAGALGIGGGLVKGPLMLQMGLNPLSAVTTYASKALIATFMLLFTSSTTTLSFALAHRLETWDALLLGSTAFVGAIVGIWVINWAIRKYKLQSVVSFVLAAVIFLSMCCMVASGILAHVDQENATEKSLDDACQTLHERRNFVVHYPLRYYWPF